MTDAAIIVAAGRGTRAGAPLPMPRAGTPVPKQWQPLAGRRVIDWTVAAFQAAPRIGQIVLVLHPDDMSLFPAQENVLVTAGGETRDASVRGGLEALTATGNLNPETANVLIHDAARCCVSPALIAATLDALDDADTLAAAPALPVTDALWTGDGDTVTGTQTRDGLFRAQTPQGFRLGAILAAHRAHPGGAADDVEVARAAGHAVRIVPGDPDNIKITHPQDFARAARILEGRMDIRSGTGFDVHRFGPGDHVMLCGIAVPHDRGLQGHSDADVGLHALADAIYGALAEGDIGRHFPPSDPQWKGAESHVFLRHAAELAGARGFRISNIDVTLICERPKIGPHAQAMCAQVARIAGIDADRVSVKATTSERLGFTGREEGIAAQAIVTLVSA